MPGDALAEAMPDRLAALLGHGVSEGLAARLQGEARLRAGLDRLLADRLGTLPELDAVQAHVLSMDGAALARLGAQAGAVWHASAIGRIVDGAAVRALVAAIGEDLRGVALRGRVLAGPETAAAPEAIAALIPHDGAACLAAWCAAQPRPVAARVALRWTPAAPGAAHRAQGPAIIAWLAEG